MPVLHFKGKTAVENHHRVVPHHVLDVVSDLSLAKKPSLEGNLIVEGDNLLALKSLMPTHAGKFDCVYIDPPYNTGNEGWVYNDNLTQIQFKEWLGKTVGNEAEDACRHEKWCCMMYPRLLLLRDLLKDSGHIMVSIDDNEVQCLRMMMDEIFGAENRIGSIVWKTRNTDGRVESMLSTDHEYVLVYAKGGAALHGRTIDRSDFKDIGDPRGPSTDRPLTGLATAEERPNLHYVITNPETGDRYPPDPGLGWITDRQGFERLLKEKRVKWPANPKTGKPRKLVFASELPERMPASTFWPDVRKESGAAELDEILGERVFAFPKSLDLMERLLDLAVGPKDLVLDATAGSGTTAHALMRLNGLDRGSRRFVLVQQAYDSKTHEDTQLNICRKITRERILRVARGYRSLSGEKVKGLGGEFTYVRLGGRLLDENRNWAETPPTYEELARYVWFTDTSQPFDPKKIDRTTGKIGEWLGASYFLLYAPDGKGPTSCDRGWLKALKDRNAKKVVYCEKVWIHRDELDEFGHVVPIQVPYHAK